MNDGFTISCENILSSYIIIEPTYEQRMHQAALDAATLIEQAADGAWISIDKSEKGRNTPSGEPILTVTVRTEIK